MKRLSMVVSAIHRKHEEEEKCKTTYDHLFPESRPSEKENHNFSNYRVRRNSIDDETEDLGKSWSRSRDRNFRFEHQDNSVCQRVDFEIIRFEEERKSKVEQNILKRKERLNELVNKLRFALDLFMKISQRLQYFIIGQRSTC